MEMAKVYGSIRGAVGAVLERVRDERRPFAVEHVTRSYAGWLMEGGKNPSILVSNDAVEADSAITVIGQHLIEASAIVERLIDAGVPEEVAYDILPYGVYRALFEKK